MNIGTLLAELSAAGIALSVEGDTLRYRAPLGTMTQERRALLAARKLEVMQALRPRRAVVSPPLHAAVRQRAPLPQEIIHKHPQCPSQRFWRHVWGDYYCLDCWPPTDPMAVAATMKPENVN
jgi:hypothetical protein